MSEPNFPDFPALRGALIAQSKRFHEAAPEVSAGFQKLHAATMKPGALDTKTKELIALSIGVAARCDACLAFHVKAALKAGASSEEVVESLGVAVLMGGGPAQMYALHALEALRQFTEAPGS